MKSRRYDNSGPMGASFTAGVEANHSSAIPSTDSDLDHAQSDDALTDDKADGNPNMSGMRDTEQMYTWLAGRLEGWQENDDYRTFFEKGKSADGLYGWGPDGDYDDNGGIPLGVGQDRGDMGSADLYGHSTGFSIGTVITRRI